MIDPFSRQGLMEEAFTGFVTFARLRRDGFAQIPQSGGI